MSNEWKRFNLEKGYSYEEETSELVAKDNGKILGFAKFSITGGVSYLSQIIVSKNNRRSGVGGLLLKEVERISKSKGCHSVYLETSNKHSEALKFYESKGYALVSEFPNHKFHFTWYRFKKDLS